MNLKKAKEVLATNVLDLSYCGMGFMPMKTIEIEVFEIMNQSKSDPHNEQTAWHERAYLLGLVDENKNTRSREYCASGDLICCSFVVKVLHDHYYREYFSGAIEVIQALRIVNKYEEFESAEHISINF